MDIRKIVLFLIIACCLGCFSDNVEITSDRRLEITGSISNSESLSNQDVLSFAGAQLMGVPNYERYSMLGKGMIDSSGNFDFISLIPEHGEIHLLINNDFSEDYDESYESIFISVEGYQENKIKLPSLNLNKAAKVKVVLRNNSGVEQGNFRVIYTQPVRFLVYDRGTLDEFEEEYFDTRDIASDIISETLEIDFRSREGEEVRVMLNYNDQQDERTFIIEPGIERYEIEF